MYWCHYFLFMTLFLFLKQRTGGWDKHEVRNSICRSLSVPPSYHVTSDGSFRWGHSEPLTEDTDIVSQAGTVPQQSPGRQTDTHIHSGLYEMNIWNLVAMQIAKLHSTYGMPSETTWTSNGVYQSLQVYWQVIQTLSPLTCCASLRGSCYSPRLCPLRRCQAQSWCSHDGWGRGWTVDTFLSPLHREEERL